MPPEDQDQPSNSAATEPPSSDGTFVDQSAGTPPSSPGSGASPDPSTPTQDTTTESSGEEPTDLMSAVRSVLKSPADPSPAAGSSAGTPEAQSGTDVTDPQTDATPPESMADFADVEKPSVRKRLEQLLAGQAAARAETASLREPADHWNRHVDFLRANNVTPDDAQKLYSVAQLIGTGQWQHAADAIRPYYELCLRQIGDILPDDLQRRVDEGGLAAETAHEIARARGDAALAQTRATIVEARRTQDVDQARVTAVRSALSTWEQGIAQRDPDYALKRDAVNTHAKAIVAERGLPPDEPTAVAWANEAYGAVHKLFQAARPQARATAPRPSSVAPAAKTAPEPRSLREAVELALHRA